VSTHVAVQNIESTPDASRESETETKQRSAPVSGDWISIWELAEQHYPEKPRFFASRLLNYSILNDLPRRTGDVLAAIGGDTERLYNISVNSPNVDRISRHVFLSLSLITSHIESRRFDPKERYLPRRPRQEEYLITKPSNPYASLPFGDGELAGANGRLNYFARMGIPFTLTRRRRYPVALDYRQNLLVDREAPQVKVMAEKLYPESAIELPEGADVPSRLGSINSEEALLWNVFRTLIREDGMHYFLKASTIFPGGDALVAPEERMSAAWFWGLNDRGSEFVPMVNAFKELGEEGDDRTIPNLTLLGINHFLLIEARYGRNFATCPKKRNGECPGREGCLYWTNTEAGIPAYFPHYVKRGNLDRTCGLHYQLTRLYLLAKAMEKVPSMGTGLVVSIIDEKQDVGKLNRKLFLDFIRHFEPEIQQRFILTSWQRIRDNVPLEPRYEELHRELREKWGI